MIGERLQKLRVEKKYTQKVIGEFLGMTPEGYGHYESGRRKPNLGIITKLAGFYNVSVDYLLGSPDNSEILDAKNEPVLRNRLSSDALKVGQAYQIAPPRVQEDTKYILREQLKSTEEIAKEIHVDFSTPWRISRQKASAGIGFNLGDEDFKTVTIRLDALPEKYRRDPSRCFGVPVDGRSMEPDYHDGDILIVGDEMAAMGGVVV